jgi:hypothetical protein
VGTLLGLLSICNAMRSLILFSAVVSILCIKESDHLLKEEGEKGKGKREKGKGKREKGKGKKKKRREEDIYRARANFRCSTRSKPHFRYNLHNLKTV